MGEKDITEKILEDHNDVFADIINGLIFAGEQRILQPIHWRLLEWQKKRILPQWRSSM